MDKDSVLKKYSGKSGGILIILGILLAAVAGFLFFTFLKNGETFLTAAFAVATGAGVIQIIRGIYKLAVPHSGKLYKQAAKFDQIEKIDDYLKNAEKDWQLVYRGKKIMLTCKYTLGIDDKGSFIVLTDNLMWVHKYTMTVNNVPSYYLKAAFFGEKTLRRIGFGRESDLTDCLCEIENKLPGVMTGFSENLMRMYAKEPNNFITLWQSNKTKV